MKKVILSTALIFALNNSTHLKAIGMLTMDLGAIASSVESLIGQATDYANQIQQYSTMAQQQMNQLKQMKEQGLTTVGLNALLGDSMKVVNDLKGKLEQLKNLPSNLFDEAKNVSNACNIISNEVKSFESTINSLSNFSDKMNKCTATLTTGTEFDEGIKSLQEKAYQAKDFKEYNENIYKIKNLENQKKYILKEANQKKINEITALYDMLDNKEGNSLYSMKKMNEMIKTYNEQIEKADNEKKRAALTNSVLISILETTQKIYEVNTRFANAMLEISSNSTQEQEKKPTKEQIKYEPRETDNNFYKDVKQAKKDKYGMPIFEIKETN